MLLFELMLPVSIDSSMGNFVTIPDDWWLFGELGAFYFHFNNLELY